MARLIPPLPTGGGLTQALGPMKDRDLSQFPLDDNGNVLWQMASDGDNLSAPRDMDFSVVFAAEAAAQAFRTYMVGCGYRAEVSIFPNPPEDQTWDVTITQAMLPAHATISAFEQMIPDEASVGGGLNDGWGSFQHP